MLCTHHTRDSGIGSHISGYQISTISYEEKKKILNKSKYEDFEAWITGSW